MNHVKGKIWEWTTEVPQYKNGDRGQLRGGSADCNTLWDIVSCRYGHNSATVYTGWTAGFRLVLYVLIL